jgi:hypothetical protein
MTDNDNEKNNVIDIDSDVYEELSLIAMRKGQDDVNEFINDVIEWGMMVGIGLDDELK